MYDKKSRRTIIIVFLAISIGMNILQFLDIYNKNNAINNIEIMTIRSINKQLDECLESIDKVNQESFQ